MIKNQKNKRELSKSNIFFHKSFFKFIASGFITTISRNILLIFLIDITNIAKAIVISGLFAALSSYFLNSKFVFKKRGYFIKFLILLISNWTLEWLFLKFLLEKINLEKVYAVFLIIPIFATISFFVQKKFVFIKTKNKF